MSEPTPNSVVIGVGAATAKAGAQPKPQNVVVEIGCAKAKFRLVEDPEPKSDKP